MKAYNIYRSIVFALSTATIFYFWNIISKILENNIWQGIILSILISFGTYKAILNVIEYTIIKFKSVKSLVFGSTYLEGIWVGCFVGHDGNPQYYIESFEQDFDGLIIRGRNFFSDGRLKGTWTSDWVTIDDVKGKITYTYMTDMIYNTYKNQGLAEFTFIRKDKRKCPLRMSGFSSDVFSPKKFLSIEEKVLEKGNLDDLDLLNKAILVYNNNKHLFTTTSSTSP